MIHPEFIQYQDQQFSIGEEIHVWRCPVKDHSERHLTAGEKERALRFRLDADRNRFATGRKFVRALLARYLPADESGIAISNHVNKKPILLTPSNELRFNISHSGNWVLVAFANADVGVDIEWVNPDFPYEDLLQDHFTEGEQAFIQDATDPMQAFYYLWTRKEAVTKGWGTGLQESLKSVAVLSSPDVYDYLGKSWKLSSFGISADYVAAVALEGPPRQIQFFNGGDFL